MLLSFVKNTLKKSLLILCGIFVPSIYINILFSYFFEERATTSRPYVYAIVLYCILVLLTTNPYPFGAVGLGSPTSPHFFSTLHIILLLLILQILNAFFLYLWTLDLRLKLRLEPRGCSRPRYH